MKPATKLGIETEDARKKIFSQDAPRGLKRSALFLFEHELARINPVTQERYTNAAALSNVLNWIHECAAKRRRTRKMLTPLEQKMLQMVIDGLSQQEVAEELNINTRNAKRHFANMRRRLGVKTMYQVVALCVSYGWVDIDSMEV